jgi:hypothetical protein
MDKGQTFSVQQALDVIEHMPLEDQMTVIQVMQHRLLEQRRQLHRNHEWRMCNQPQFCQVLTL